jgi:hypothetical protein
MAKEKKNQHYVPASYLRGFTIDGEDSLVWGYTKIYGKCTGKRSVDRICSEDYYYQQPTPDGSTTQIMEEAFIKPEKAAIEIIRKLNPQYTISESDKGILAFYIALLLTRGPSFRDGIHSCLKYSVEISTQKLFEMGKLPPPPKELLKHIKNNDITSVVDIDILPHISLRYMIDSAIQIAESLCRKNWIFFFSDKDLYITSDTPVLFGSLSEGQEQIGPANPLSWIICPLTKNIALTARPYHSSDNSAFEFSEAEKNFVELVNQMECWSSQKFIYSPIHTKEILEYVKTAKGYSQKTRAFRFGDLVIQKWGIHKD